MARRNRRNRDSDNEESFGGRRNKPSQRRRSGAGTFKRNRRRKQRVDDGIDDVGKPIIGRDVVKIPKSPVPTKPPVVKKKPKLPKPPEKAKEVGGTGAIGKVIVSAYKGLDTYINQYPATDSSVKEAGETNIKQYYSGQTVRGHYGNSQTVNAPNDLGGATVVAGTSINFILLIDGSPYTSPQFKEKMNRASSEGNAYFNMSVPIVEINTSDIRPYVDKELFRPQEEYATNVPTTQLDSIEEIVKHVDWICQKTEIEQPLRDGNGDLGAFKTKDEIAGTVTLDEIIAGSNKPPKIRWRQRKNRI
tara:strand:+ start:2715 stop:3626 length:912 start_codon:yes stop_codon:yes gene_type:complete